ncbi:peptide chain release factor N(5)-glutamine methyltransferase [Cohaesibacter sp. CAU 1516]|uniref:peptide chain release factor N(5)-glutamine methyltransferase n=1 Tax=Cohaesibacter sp. CAU 1516 TaxID=2576038 RepID=UPI0010FE7AA8|nr:peptide chain release factor N(5)-glutamine methyltransferase [Cohaesibacter sp. CAU 1516]TLP42613.1 peptide chain release factor N(5)-glutamine methyltransferase [Cohaesibacter sp. CAU 1516]
MRLDQMIAAIAARFAGVGIDSARLDARLLACHALGLTETDMILQFDRTLCEDEAEAIEALAARRLKREPVAHILGQREFWGLPFHVSSDVLVPRPDSETLVSAVLEAVPDRTAPLRIVDIGTGSGCLLLALLSELPNAQGLGVDISEAALTIAQRNAEDLGLADRVSFVQGDYANAIGPEVDILISNPPYLADKEMADLEPDVANYDPRHALVSGASGLEAYEAIFSTVGAWGKRPDVMAFEFGYRQAKDILLLSQQYKLCGDTDMKCEVRQDLAGHDRVLLVSAKPAIPA